MIDDSDKEDRLRYKDSLGELVAKEDRLPISTKRLEKSSDSESFTMQHGANDMRSKHAGAVDEVIGAHPNATRRLSEAVVTIHTKG